jgi:hypothetical protein
VTEYVRFTNRLPITADFTPTPAEQQLYDQVSDYLQRPELIALPTGQRKLITLVLRKLLASSTFAIAGNRYKALQDFLSPANIVKVEGQLRQAHKQIAERFDDASSAKGHADDALSKLWEAEGRPGTDYLAWAQAQSQQTAADLQLQDILEETDYWLAALDATTFAHGNLQTAEQKHQLNTSDSEQAAVALA